MKYSAVAVVGLMAAACVALPTDSTWGDVSLTSDTPARIMLAFSDKIVQVDPSTGVPIPLLDPATGKERTDTSGKALSWLLQSPGATNGATFHFYTRPVVLPDKTLLTLNYENKLFQIDNSAARVMNAGIQLDGNNVGNPLLNGNLLYVPTSNGLLALDPTDYTQKWKFPANKNMGVWSQPLLEGDTLYVSSMDHHLYAIDAQTGSEKWKADPDLEGAVASTPVFANGALYVGSFGRKVFKITTDGTIAEQFTTNDWVWGAPTVVGDMVYVTDLSGYIYALKDSGTSLDMQWNRKVAGGAIRMPPLVTGDTIIVGSRDHDVYWINRETGAEIFHRELKGEVLSNILLLQPTGTITDPMIVVSTIDQSELLVAFTLDQGVQRWIYPLPG